MKFTVCTSDARYFKVSDYEFIPETCGVYCLYNKGGVLLYIGKTTNLLSRVYVHIKDADIKDIEYIEVMEIDDWLDADLAETYLINKRKSLLNKKKIFSDNQENIYEEKVEYLIECCKNEKEKLKNKLESINLTFLYKDVDNILYRKGRAYKSDIYNSLRDKYLVTKKEFYHLLEKGRYRFTGDSIAFPFSTEENEINEVKKLILDNQRVSMAALERGLQEKRMYLRPEYNSSILKKQLNKIINCGEAEIK